MMHLVCIGVVLLSCLAGCESVYPQETLDSYHGVVSPYLEPVKALHGYDNYHKYGGIGKKLHLGSSFDHGAKGYKNHYGDSAYANQGLNKYDKNYLSNKFGGNHEGYHNHHGSHVYTRNRGYGFEKHYMYDKEYSTAKKEGSDSGHGSYHGSLKKDNKYGLDSYKNYGHKNYGHKDGHAEHALGKYDHLIDHHADHVIKPDLGHGHGYLKTISDTPHYSVPVHHQHTQYIPVVGELYGGALGHATSSHPHVDDLHYDDLQHHHLPSSAEAVYVPSSSDGPVHENVNSKLKSTRAIDSLLDENEPEKRANIMSIPLAQPQTAQVNTNPSLATLAEAYGRVKSAAHATPAVISTHTGAHYYSS